MKTIAGVLIVAAVAFFGSGCARSDWIERTLVTVDVTGTWSGNVEGVNVSGTLWFELEQQGSTVKGSMQYVGGLRGGGHRLPSTSRPIDATVAGDVFRFRQRDSTVEGELTVSGDEMTGKVWVGGAPPDLAPTCRSILSPTSVTPPFPLARGVAETSVKKTVMTEGVRKETRPVTG